MFCVVFSSDGPLIICTDECGWLQFFINHLQTVLVCLYRFSKINRRKITKSRMVLSRFYKDFKIVKNTFVLVVLAWIEDINGREIGKRWVFVVEGKPHPILECVGLSPGSAPIIASC